MDIETPFSRFTDRVRPEWVDYNRHLNVAYYFLIFDNATDLFYDHHLGLDRAYRDATNSSTFTLEGHITYDRELLEGDPVRVTTRLIDFDAKRLHYFHEMYHAEQGYLAATNELLGIHIDMGIRRSSPMPERILERLAAIKEAHAALPMPAQVGRRIGIASKKPR